MMEIYVGNLGYSADERKLRKLFERHGKVAAVTRKYTGSGMLQKMFAIVEMPVKTEGEKAVKELNNSMFDDKKIFVKEHIQKKAVSGKKRNGKNSTKYKGKDGIRQERSAKPSKDADDGFFINPYNFVNAVEVKDAFMRKYFEEEPHFQDRFREGTHSGRIVCKLTTESDLFIGAGKSQDCNDSNKIPAKLKPFTLNGERAIPSSSLKGMISSVMEAASNSALRVLDNKRLYTRRTDFKSSPGVKPEILDKIGIIVQVDEQKFIRPLKTAKPERQKEDEPFKVNQMFPVYLNYYANGVPKGFLSNKIAIDYSVVKKEYHLNEDDIKYKFKKGWLLGYELKKPGSNPFITEEDYKKKDTDEQKKYRKGIFKILGIGEKRKDNIETKKHEFFLFMSEKYDKKSLINLETAEPDFNILSDDRSSYNTKEKDIKEYLPYTPIGRPRQKENGKDVIRLKENDIVYYEDDGRKNATMISFSACWRRFCGNTKEKNSAYDHFRSVDRHGFLLPPFMINQKINEPANLKLTPVCSLLGFVEEKSQAEVLNRQKNKAKKPGLALAGRLFFSTGILLNNPVKEVVCDDEKPLKILASPKPPCPEFYFHKRDKPKDFITKKDLRPDENIIPNGRKLYHHHHNPVPYLDNEKDERFIKDHSSHLSRIKPIKEGAEFVFSIDFFNLTEFELGMLLYALKPTDRFRHLIGMGKPLGLGKVNIEILNLLFVNRKERYAEDNLFDNFLFHKQIDACKQKLDEVCKKLKDGEKEFYQKRFHPVVRDNNQPGDKTVKEGADINHFVTTFKVKITEHYGEKWLGQLENMGDPAFAGIKDTPVQYPNLKKGGMDESFKWWMRNAGKETRKVNNKTVQITGKKCVLEKIPESIDHAKKAEILQLPFNPEAQ